MKITMTTTMQNALLYILLCMLSIPLWAQKESKATVFKAERYYVAEEFDKARDEIDRVLENPKKAKKSHIWNMRGKIYKASMLDEKSLLEEGQEEAWGVEAARSFAKVVEKQSEGSSMYVEAFNAFNEIWGHFVARGLLFYRKKDYKKAYQKFKATVLIKPEDSVSLSYTGWMASQSEYYDEALVYYYKLIGLKKADVDIFADVFYIEKEIRKDLEASEKVLQAALQVYPDNKGFAKEQAKLFSELGKEGLAIQKIRDIIAKHPDDAQSYLNLAFIYDNWAIDKINKNDMKAALPYLDTAALYYHKSVEIDSTSLVANYNLGVVYTNKARQYGDEVRKMTLQEYEKRGKALEERSRTIIRQGLPYLERAYALQSDDYEVVSALQQVYNQLGMKSKAQTFKERLKALEAKE